MNALSKSELSTLLEIISDCAYCTTLEGFFLVANKICDMLQAENLVFLSSQLNFSNAPQVIKEINISYPTEWVEIYRSQNFVTIDPIMTKKQSGLLYWKDVYRVFPPDKEFYAQAKSFGISNGFSHILPGSTVFGLMSVADKKLDNREHNVTILNTLAPHFHQLVAKLVHKRAYQELPKLTSRERDVLLWVMEGKTNWEISVILGISQDVVKDHIANVLRKFDASNRTHAVAIAIQHDLLRL